MDQIKEKHRPILYVQIIPINLGKKTEFTFTLDDSKRILRDRTSNYFVYTEKELPRLIGGGLEIGTYGIYKQRDDMLEVLKRPEPTKSIFHLNSMVEQLEYILSSLCQKGDYTEDLLLSLKIHKEMNEFINYMMASLAGELSLSNDLLARMRAELINMKMFKLFAILNAYDITLNDDEANDYRKYDEFVTRFEEFANSGTSDNAKERYVIYDNEKNELLAKSTFTEKMKVLIKREAVRQNEIDEKLAETTELMEVIEKCLNMKMGEILKPEEGIGQITLREAEEFLDEEYSNVTKRVRILNVSQTGIDNINAELKSVLAKLIKSIEEYGDKVNETVLGEIKERFAKFSKPQSVVEKKFSPKSQTNEKRDGTFRSLFEKIGKIKNKDTK